MLWLEIPNNNPANRHFACGCGCLPTHTNLYEEGLPGTRTEKQEHKLKLKRQTEQAERKAAKQEEEKRKRRKREEYQAARDQIRKDSDFAMEVNCVLAKLEISF